MKPITAAAGTALAFILLVLPAGAATPPAPQPAAVSGNALTPAGTPQPAATMVPVNALTLDEALARALAHNHDLQSAREYHNYVMGYYYSERSAAFPQLTITATDGRSRDYASGVTSPGTDPLIAEARTADLGANWTIFSWGKVSAVLRVAAIGIDNAEVKLAVQRQLVVEAVTTAFYNCLLADELTAIARQNLAQKQRHFDEASRRNTAGTATDYDVLAAEVAVANARPEVIRAENSIRATREQLAYLLGTGDSGVTARGSLAAAMAITPVPVENQALATALAKRPELTDISQQEQVAAELVTIANAGDKPSVALTGQYGWHELAYGPGAEDGRDWSAGVVLSYPIFDGFRTAGRVQQAESQRATLAIRHAQLRDGITLEVRTTLDRVREAEEIVTALSRTVQQAERLLTMAEKGFEAGVKTRLDVDDAQLNLDAARGNLARARRDYLVARVSLDRAMGTLAVPATPGAIAIPAMRGSGIFLHD